MTRKRKSKKKILSGLMNSGLLFIGDPTFMMGGSDPQIQADGTVRDITPLDPHNPFRREQDWMPEALASDVNLPIVEALDGRGVVVNCAGMESRYEVKKRFKDGKLVEIKIILK